MALPVKFVCLFALVISVYIQTIACDSAETTCYCLSKELEDLRNPVHIESGILDDQQVYFIAEQLGVISVYNPSAGNKLQPYIDIKDKVVCEAQANEERGLLGFALHPKFSHNKKVYLYSIRDLYTKEWAVISEVEDRDLDTEKILLLVEQPGKTRNGGQVSSAVCLLVCLC